MDPTGCTIQSDGIGEHVTPPITAVGLSPSSQHLKHYADDHDGGDSSQFPTVIWRENKDYADLDKLKMFRKSKQLRSEQARETLRKAVPHLQNVIKHCCYSHKKKVSVLFSYE
jgi:hypothetical protein